MLLRISVLLINGPSCSLNFDFSCVESLVELFQILLLVECCDLFTLDGCFQILYLAFISFGVEFSSLDLQLKVFVFQSESFNLFQD